MTGSLTDSPAPIRDAPPTDNPTSAQRTGWIRRLSTECWRHRRLVVVTLAVTLVAVAVDLVAPLLAKAAIDHATGAQRGGATISVIVAALLSDYLGLLSGGYVTAAILVLTISGWVPALVLLIFFTLLLGSLTLLTADPGVSMVGKLAGGIFVHAMAIFDAYRDEAKAAGQPAGPDCLALRRRVAVGSTPDEARTYASAITERLKAYVAQDSRVTQHVPDSPARSGGGFTVSDDEFITGTPKQAAAQIIEQCRAIGAGHFLAMLNWGAPVDEVEQAHEAFGREAIPLLRAASV